jgi:pimeloyl-ACP methyl ester carboxylesterase
MNRIARNYLIITSLLTVSVLPVACASGVQEFREVTAERIARPAFMVERKFDTGTMQLQLWERAHQPHASANIYIEGDGEVIGFAGKQTNDPTPKNPVALNLASRDLSENLFYIARPCQFRESPDEKACPSKFWGARRFSPEVITAYNQVLDDIKKRYDITEFNIIGYDGGANIAAALASQRKDIVTLRTVAGNLAPDVTNFEAKKSLPLDSDFVSAKALAQQLAGLGQHHFVGAGDTVTPPSVYHSYAQALGASECVHYTLVPDADHTNGWVDKWPELLQHTITCPVSSSASILPDNYIPAPLPEIPVELKPERK